MEAATALPSDIINRTRLHPSVGTTREGGMITRVTGVIDEINADWETKRKELGRQLDELSNLVELTSKKAKLALEAHLHTVSAAKVQAEALHAVVDELRAGHAKLINSFNGKEAQT